MFFDNKKNQDYFAILPIELLNLIAQYLVDIELKNLIIFSLLTKNTHAESLKVAAKSFPDTTSKKSALILMREKQALYECNLNKSDFDKYLKIFKTYKYLYERVEKCIIEKNCLVDTQYAYELAMLLFSDYCKHQPYYLRGAEKAARFFTGAWNHTHNAAVSRVMMKHDPSGLGPEAINYDFSSLENILKDLKNELLQDGNILKKK